MTTLLLPAWIKSLSWCICCRSSRFCSCYAFCTVNLKANDHTDTSTLKLQNVKARHEPTTPEGYSCRTGKGETNKRMKWRKGSCTNNSSKGRKTDVENLVAVAGDSTTAIITSTHSLLFVLGLSFRVRFAIAAAAAVATERCSLFPKER